MRGSGRRRLTAGAVRVLALLVAGPVVVAGLAGCDVDRSTAAKAPPAPVAGTSEAAAPSGSSSYDATPADEQAIADLMTARATAVMHHDLRAFRATVDGRQPKLRAAQTVLFRNLVALHADTLWYDVAGTYLVPAPVPGRDPVLHPEVLEHLKLPATLSRPLANRLDLTFVRRDDRWLVGAERAPGAKGSVEEPQERPWFGVPIAVRRDGELTVIVDAEHRDRLGGLAEAVQDGIDRDAGILGVPPDSRILVDATSNGVVDDFGPGVDDTVAAVTLPLFAGDQDGVDTVTGTAGVAIKINPDQVEELMTDDRVLWHELTHSLLSGFVGQPVWLTEGVASWVQWQPARLSQLVIPADLYRRLQREPHELPTEGVFYGKPDVHYIESQAAVQWLVDRGGAGRLRELMRYYTHQYGKAKNADSVTAKALRTVYDLRPQEVADGAWEALATLHQE